MENFIRALKLECLDKIIFRSPEQLRYAIKQYLEYWNHYRPHAGLDGKKVKPYEQSPDGKIIDIPFLGGGAAWIPQGENCGMMGKKEF